MVRKKQLIGATSTIMVTLVTKERIARFGKIGDTYDEAINRAIDEAEQARYERQEQ